MRVGTRALKCPYCKEPANINEMDYAQCAKSDCINLTYLPVAKWNTQVKEVLLFDKAMDNEKKAFIHTSTLAQVV